MKAALYLASFLPLAFAAPSLNVRAADGNWYIQNLVERDNSNPNVASQVYFTLYDGPVNNASTVSTQCKYSTMESTVSVDTYAPCDNQNYSFEFAKNSNPTRELVVSKSYTHASGTVWAKQYGHLYVNFQCNKVSAEETDCTDEHLQEMPAGPLTGA
ncbi:hypothetical protein PVAR5_3558 [Paecilomyces variotii No. 5]|uniref:AA1-like domain-containing protein n=1 Tax=Byssochlamys spectabilis (strain No. 5 / NBRC 109023) TaxID=1356009 RepID=V5HY92_BYSSN|nr:hypothetical protein PVAR5_3558 [Paecilomyces variotii No. 5]